MKMISQKYIVKSTLVLVGFILFFHALVLFQAIPYQIVWGGRLQSLGQMRVFEIISISINSFFMIVLAIKGGYVRPVISIGVISSILRVFAVLFAINTIGNLFAKASLETIVFTPITFVSAIACYLLAKNNNYR